jgi:hypothetical protein
MEGVDQLEGLLGEITQIVSAYDDRDRLMLRRGHEPHLDGFIDEKGKVRFKPSQLDSAASVPERGSGQRHGFPGAISRRDESQARCSRSDGMWR